MAACVRGFNTHDNAYADSFRSLAEIYHWRNDVRRGKRRTREIGLRMSVGARGVDILNQFLIEAILLSVTGGVIGVLLGVSLSVGLQQFLHVATQIEPWSIIMSFAVCTFTGVFFGWYPAKKAARLDPIEAIRYE